MLVLRDMIETDIEDYVKWFTEEMEWSNWDGPWEPLTYSEGEARRKWTEDYKSIKDLPDHAFRRKFEVELDGEHIGWITSYTNLGYFEDPENSRAIGLDIPCINHRNQGCGTKAIQLYMDYLKQQGHTAVCLQTWSGNLAVIRVAEKLGFREVCRKKDYRTVNGHLYDAITWKRDL